MHPDDRESRLSGSLFFVLQTCQLHSCIYNIPAFSGVGFLGRLSLTLILTRGYFDITDRTVRHSGERL